MPTENKPAEPLPKLAVDVEPKPYPDRLCHIDYTAHPHRCGCWSGDHEAQRRFDEYQRDTKLATAESEVARLTAERDALQQCLNAADQRNDELVSLLRDHFGPEFPATSEGLSDLGKKAWAAVTATSIPVFQPFTEQFIEDHLGKMPSSKAQ